MRRCTNDQLHAISNSELFERRKEWKFTCLAIITYSWGLFSKLTLDSTELTGFLKCEVYRRKLVCRKFFEISSSKIPKVHNSFNGEYDVTNRIFVHGLHFILKSWTILDMKLQLFRTLFEWMIESGLFAFSNFLDFVDLCIFRV